MAKSKYRLPDESVAGLMQAQRELHDALPELDGAEQCGIDCQEYRRLHAEATARIQALLDTYGPAIKVAQ